MRRGGCHTPPLSYDDTSGVLVKLLNKGPQLTLFHCRLINFTNALTKYIALFTVVFVAVAIFAVNLAPGGCVGLRGGTHHEIPEVSAVGLRSYVEADAEACACVWVGGGVWVCVCVCVCVGACVGVGVWVCSPQPRSTPAAPAAWPAFLSVPLLRFVCAPAALTHCCNARKNVCSMLSVTMACQDGLSTADTLFTDLVTCVTGVTNTLVWTAHARHKPALAAATAAAATATATTSTHTHTHTHTTVLRPLHSR
jgi:hypothetical protein